MRCPFCNHDETKVLETRETGEDITRRRRECLKCSKRFTTYEQVELTNLNVIKKDGRRVVFDKQKIINSMQVACQKRNISLDQIEDIASRIEAKVRNSMEKEVSSRKIGGYVMDELKELDDVSYVRFASVYRDFKTLKSFKKELEKLSK
ncbi:MAG: transcriptional regulator NrdR [Candidatus Woesearchaeota archaeon]